MQKPGPADALRSVGYNVVHKSVSWQEVQTDHREANTNKKTYKMEELIMNNNMPNVKIGVVAVSRDCFPESLSVNRRKALMDAYKA